MTWQCISGGREGQKGSRGKRVVTVRGSRPPCLLRVQLPSITRDSPLLLTIGTSLIELSLIVSKVRRVLVRHTEWPHKLGFRHHHDSVPDRLLISSVLAYLLCSTPCSWETSRLPGRSPDVLSHPRGLFQSSTPVIGSMDIPVQLVFEPSFDCEYFTRDFNIRKIRLWLEHLPRSKSVSLYTFLWTQGTKWKTKGMRLSKYLGLFVKTRDTFGVLFSLLFIVDLSRSPNPLLPLPTPDTT